MATTVTLKDGRTFTLPFLHFGVMGKPGSGKSHLLASMPKPLLIIATDPMTKMQPYFDQGVLDPVEHTGALGQEIRLVKDADGKTLIQVEGFYDNDPLNPLAMTNICARMAQVQGEVKNGLWASLGFDSWSGFEDVARYRRLAGPMKINNPDGRAHHNIAKEDCKGIFNMQLVHLKCNVGITFHITEKMLEGGGQMLYNMKCIGDFASTVGQNLAERYRAEAMPDGVTRQLYTRPDGRFELATLIGAPSPCENNFNALWGPWLAKKMTEPMAETATPSEEKA